MAGVEFESIEFSFCCGFLFCTLFPKPIGPALIFEEFSFEALSLPLPALIFGNLFGNFSGFFGIFGAFDAFAGCFAFEGAFVGFFVGFLTGFFTGFCCVATGSSFFVGFLFGGCLIVCSTLDSLLVAGSGFFVFVLVGLFCDGF